MIALALEAPLDDRRLHVEFLPEFLVEQAVDRIVGADAVLRDVPLRLLDRLPSLFGNGGATLPAVPTVGLGHRPTVPAGRPTRPRLLVRVREPSADEEVAIPRLGVEVVVALPHLGILRPPDPMPDVILRERIVGHHARNRRMAEVVGVRRLVDARAASSGLEHRIDALVAERAVVRGILRVVVLGMLVEQRRLGLVAPRMVPVQVPAQDRGAIDQRVWFVRDVLQPVRAHVGGERRPVRVEGEVLHSERAEQRDPGARVGEHLDECLVADAPRLADECLHFVGGVHVVAVDGALGPALGEGAIDIVPPVPVEEFKEVPERAAVLVHRLRAQGVALATAVLDGVQQAGHRLGVLEVGQGRVALGGGDAQLALVSISCRVPDAVLDVAVLVELDQRLAIRLGDLALLYCVREALALVGELRGEIVDVVDPSHAPRSGAEYLGASQRYSRNTSVLRLDYSATTTTAATPTDGAAPGGIPA